MSSLTLTIDLGNEYWQSYGNNGFFGETVQFYTGSPVTSSSFTTPYTVPINTYDSYYNTYSNTCSFSSTSYTINENVTTNAIAFTISNNNIAVVPNTTGTDPTGTVTAEKIYSTKITMDVTLTIEYEGIAYSLDFTVTTNPFAEVVSSGTTLTSYFILQNSNFASTVATNTTKDPSIFYGSSIVLDRSSYVSANSNNCTFGDVTFPLIFQISNISDGSA